jgi:hypothetical protein
MPIGVYKRTKEHSLKLSQAHLGNKLSSVTRKKISIAVKGKNSGEKHYKWEGNNAGYSALHKWVQKELGKPHFCEGCGNRDLEHRQYHWANISGNYKRVLSDWRRLCVKCHIMFDTNRGNKANKKK